MLRLTHGPNLTRRNLLEAAGAGLFGLTLPKLLAAETSLTTIAPRAKSVIFMTLFGGPSQLETFDLKPNAPEKIAVPSSRRRARRRAS
jgi:hypothetical protein